jgi:uncharacterized protein YndB with AHSA1/START domain
MAKIYHKFTIEAPASEVYSLLTTIPGLQKWWVKKSSGNPEVGGELEFGDKSMFYNKMKVKFLEENKKVVWEVIESIGPTEDSKLWDGTTIEFDLEEKKLARLDNKDATIVLFKHDGWPDSSQDSKFFAEVNWHWAFFTLSLKNAVEGKEVSPM